MELLITHVTRMARGFCCVAGLTRGDYRHVRPVLGGQRLTTDLLSPVGPFDMRAIVELGRVHDLGQRPPEVEDHLFRPENSRRIGYAAPERMWELLESTASDSLHEIFGEELERRSERASVPLLSGRASLGTYRPMLGCQLVVRSEGDHKSLRVRLPGEALDLSLTDARFFEDEYQRPRVDRIAAVREAIDAGEPVILGVGLTRPFKSAEDKAERHWLQVNAVHVRSLVGMRLE